MRSFVLLLLLALLVYSTSSFSRQLAIVIDDLGYSLINGKRSIDLPGDITVAILPFAPNSIGLSEYAKHKNKEVIVHLPMQAKSETNQKIERPTLNITMSSIQYAIILEASLSRFTHAKGLSNHMGSLLTERIKPMRRVLLATANRNLYFLDSKTSSQSIAKKVAHEMRAPYIARDFFLDNIRTEQNMKSIMESAFALSRKTGDAVIIGHPYQGTLDFLERELRKLPSDIELVFASQLPTIDQAVVVLP